MIALHYVIGIVLYILVIYKIYFLIYSKSPGGFTTGDNLLNPFGGFFLAGVKIYNVIGDTYEDYTQGKGCYSANPFKIL